MDVNKNKISITANEAYAIYGVTRAWLRENAEAGAIRKTAIEGVNKKGYPYVRNLYNVEDIEKIMAQVVDEEPKY